MSETLISLFFILVIIVACAAFYYVLFGIFNLGDGYRTGKRGHGYYNNNALYLAVWYHWGYKWGFSRYLRSHREYVPYPQKNIKRFKMEEYR